MRVKCYFANAPLTFFCPRSLVLGMFLSESRFSDFFRGAGGFSLR